MAGFEKVKLLTGEARGDYIARRLGEGMTAQAITAEINAPALFSGEAGKPWPIGVVYAVKGKQTPKKAAASVPDAGSKTSSLDERLRSSDEQPKSLEVVPAQYEDILTPEDVAEVKREAAEQVRKKQRKIARASLLAEATANLEREARAAAQRGVARGDNVDITIDLAPYADRLTIDGHVYMHGTTHRVPRGVAKVLQEQMKRSWEHQDSISGQKNDFNRLRNVRINGGGSTGSAPLVSGAEGLRA